MRRTPGDVSGSYPLAARLDKQPVAEPPEDNDWYEARGAGVTSPRIERPSKSGGRARVSSIRLRFARRRRRPQNRRPLVAGRAGADAGTRRRQRDCGPRHPFIQQICERGRSHRRGRPPRTCARGRVRRRHAVAALRGPRRWRRSVSIAAAVPSIERPRVLPHLVEAVPRGLVDADTAVSR